MNKNSILNQIIEAMADIDEEKVLGLVDEAVKKNIPASEIVLHGLAKGMEIVGERYEALEYFLSELVMSADIMKRAVRILEPHLKAEKIPEVGVFVIGTVQGDLHDLGKNLVINMMNSAGFRVYDLGIDVPAQIFVEKVRELRPGIIGMSCMLLSTMTSMKEVIDVLKKNGLRDEVKIMVGGRPVSKEYALEIGADGYAKDAVEAVQVAKALMRQ